MIDRRTADLIAIGQLTFAMIFRDIYYQFESVIAEHIRSSVEHLPRVGGDTVPITVSIGLSTWTKNSRTTLEELLLNADQALYEAKHTGRNRVVDAGALKP